MVETSEVVAEVKEMYVHNLTHDLKCIYLVHLQLFPKDIPCHTSMFSGYYSGARVVSTDSLYTGCIHSIT